MAARQWNILLVEDDSDDYLLTKDMLSEARETSYILDWASDYEVGKKLILSKQYDAILMDYQLGPRTGLELTREVTAAGCKAPIILLTGHGNYDVDMQAMESGVTDYLSKNEATASFLERTIRYAISQKQTEEALRKVKEELETRVQERTRELFNKNTALEAQITERKRIEAELAEVQSRLLDRAEAERLELARDLHDGPMQELYALVYALDAIPVDLSSDQGQAAVKDMKEKLLQLIHSLRSISRELRPPSLAPYGLEKAIRSHAEGIQQTQKDLSIHLALDPDRQLLPETVRLALYRIYQVAITNILRHSEATEAYISFHLNEEHAILEIKDNGCGFDVPRRWIEMVRQGHLGLAGAAERAEAAGGKMEIHSAPNVGTTIRVTVPR